MRSRPKDWCSCFSEPHGRGLWGAPRTPGLCRSRSGQRGGLRLGPPGAVASLCSSPVLTHVGVYWWGFGGKLPAHLAQALRGCS